jgi:hypothetical protein
LWADLVAATVDIGGQRRRVADYRHLAYDAERHNWNETLWILFDPPVGDAHGLEVAQVFGGMAQRAADSRLPMAGPRYTARTLNENLETLREMEVLSVARIAPVEVAFFPLTAR